MVRSEKRPILGPDFGGWRNSLVEEILRKGPNYGVLLLSKLNKTNNIDCVDSGILVWPINGS
jgi:hypothetical protein